MQPDLAAGFNLQNRSYCNFLYLDMHVRVQL